MGGGNLSAHKACLSILDSERLPRENHVPHLPLGLHTCAMRAIFYFAPKRQGVACWLATTVGVGAGWLGWLQSWQHPCPRVAQHWSAPRVWG